jgi:hypothetical protein
LQNPEGVSFFNILKFVAMPGAFSQVYLQVFAVSGKENLIGLMSDSE